MSASRKLNLRFSLLTLLILLAAFCRILPRPFDLYNFSPVGAMALFGAACFTKKWQALLIPVLATWLSDLYLNNVIYAQYYSSFTWFAAGFYWQYGTYLLITLVGFFLFNKKITAPLVLTGSLLSTALFFVITNFACWPGSTTYSQDINGLMTCYAAGIPFLKGTFYGDLFYCSVLFGAFALLQPKLPALRFPKRVAF